MHPYHDKHGHSSPGDVYSSPGDAGVYNHMPAHPYHDKHGHSSPGDVYSSPGDADVYNHVQLVHKPGDYLVVPFPINSNTNGITCIIIINMHVCDDRSYMVTHKIVLYFSDI